MTYSESGRHHAYHDYQRRHYGRSSGVEQLLEAEFESERKEQHHDSKLGPELDVAFGGHRREIFKVRAGEKSCDDVAEHDRLFQPFEQHGHYCAQYEDECKVGYERFQLYVRHYFRIFGRCISCRRYKCRNEVEYHCQ